MQGLTDPEGLDRDCHPDVGMGGGEGTGHAPPGVGIMSASGCDRLASLTPAWLHHAHGGLLHRVSQNLIRSVRKPASRRTSGLAGLCDTPYLGWELPRETSSTRLPYAMLPTPAQSHLTPWLRGVNLAGCAPESAADELHLQVSGARRGREDRSLHPESLRVVLQGHGIHRGSRALSLHAHLDGIGRGRRRKQSLRGRGQRIHSKVRAGDLRNQGCMAMLRRCGVARLRHVSCHRRGYHVVQRPPAMSDREAASRGLRGPGRSR